MVDETGKATIHRMQERKSKTRKTKESKCITRVSQVNVEFSVFNTWDFTNKYEKFMCDQGEMIWNRLIKKEHLKASKHM